MKTKYAVLGTVTLMVASVGLWVGQPHAQTQSPVVTRTSRFQPPAPTDNLLAHALMQRRAQQQATKQAVSVQLANKNAATQAHGQGNAKTVPAGQIHGATTSTKNVSSSSQTTASGATSPTAGTTTAAKPATSTPAPSATRAPASMHRRRLRRRARQDRASAFWVSRCPFFRQHECYHGARR